MVSKGSKQSIINKFLLLFTIDITAGILMVLMFIYSLNSFELLIVFIIYALMISNIHLFFKKEKTEDTIIAMGTLSSIFLIGLLLNSQLLQNLNISTHTKHFIEVFVMIFLTYFPLIIIKSKTFNILNLQRFILYYMIILTLILGIFNIIPAILEELNYYWLIIVLDNTIFMIINNKFKKVD